VTSFFLQMNRTRSRRDYNERTGSITQQLLTIVVGLSAVENGAERPVSLPATWNPQSRVDAARRARSFANQAALVWTMESVIGYVNDLMRERPGVLGDDLRDSLRTITDKESRLGALARAMGIADSVDLDLVRAGYVWRNRLTHLRARNALKPDVISGLEMHAEHISEHFQGLRTSDMILRIQGNNPPRLKEVSSVVRAAAQLVREIDGRVISTVNLGDYVGELLKEHLSEPETADGAMRRAVGLWGGTAHANARSIAAFACQHGLAPSQSPTFDSSLDQMIPTEALALLLPGRGE